MKNLFSQPFINELAESHIESWKERYWRKSKKDIAFDLRMNHDDSLELERAQEHLGRELTDKEQTYLINQFHKAVTKLIY